MHKLKLVLGDWSGDGHGKTDIFLIESNLSEAKLCSAYKKGTKKIGFDFTEKICVEYEESEIDLTTFNALSDKLGKINISEYNIDYEDECVTLDQEVYTEIFLKIVQLGDKSFEYEIVTDDFREIHIGGYGLFYG